MPALLFILLLPFIVLFWGVSYAIQFRKRKMEEQFRAEIEKKEREAQIARPLRDYVAGMQPGRARRISLLKTTPPSPGNIGRFAALALRAHVEEYFVRDQDGTVFGPADEETMLQLAQEKRITPDTLLSTHAQGPWMPARSVRSLKNAFSEAEDPPASSARFDHLKIK